MNLTEALLFLALMVYMIASQVGVRPLSAARLWRPALIFAAVSAFTLRGVDLSGGAGLLAALGLGLGTVFGLLAAAFMRVEERAGRAFTVAGWPYALVWVVSMGGRVVFGLLATSDGPVQDAVVRFSMDHHISGATGWTTAFLLMTAAEVLVRTLLVLTRARRARPLTSRAVPAGS